MDLNLSATIPPEQYWKSLKGDEGQALEALYRLYANPLFNYGSKFTSDSEQIGESIQSLFVKIWTSRHSLGNPENVRNYLFKAFRLTLFKEIKRKQTQEEFDQDGNYIFLATLSLEHEIITEDNQLLLQQRLQAGLDQLSSRQREAIFLRFYEGMDYAEVAAIMDISVKGTYKLMARAIDTLREKLDQKDFPLLLLLLSFKLYN